MLMKPHKHSGEIMDEDEADILCYKDEEPSPESTTKPQNGLFTTAPLTLSAERRISKRQLGKKKHESAISQLCLLLLLYTPGVGLWRLLYFPIDVYRCCGRYGVHTYR